MSCSLLALVGGARDGQVNADNCVQAVNWHLLDAAASPTLQVYEQLYDTLDITGSAEVRAHATAKVGACPCSSG